MGHNLQLLGHVPQCAPAWLRHWSVPCVILNLPTPPVRSEMSSWTAKQWNKKLNVSAYCKSNRIFSPVWNDQRLILSSSVSYLAREVNLATETIVYQARPSLTGRRLNSSVRRVGERSWSSLTDYNDYWAQAFCSRFFLAALEKRSWLRPCDHAVSWPPMWYQSI